MPGDTVAGVGYDVYKVRLRNRSASRGKSGGFRVIYFLRQPSAIVLLTIYSKTAKVDIHASDIRDIIRSL